jgi:hypothetical protein
LKEIDSKSIEVIYDTVLHKIRASKADSPLRLDGAEEELRSVRVGTGVGLKRWEFKYDKPHLVSQKQ